MQPSASPFSARHRMAGHLYHSVGVESKLHSSSPHGLVTMLFDGLMEALALAQAAMRDGQIEAKGKALGRAVRIIDHGLKAALNIRDGGQLAADLSDLYAYTTLRLTQANLRNDAAAVDECRALLQPLREAWISIAPEVDRNTR